MINDDKLSLIELSYELEKYGTPAQVNFTIFLLQVAEKFNCKCVGLDMWCPKLKDSASWVNTFGKERVFGNLFADGMSYEILLDANGNEYQTKWCKWPTAWNILSYLSAYYKDEKLNSGCGNSGQHTFRSKTHISGIYKIVKNCWVKIG
jgi:hypothetical protein